ncbi:MAG: DUF934 domain-containing protein [Parvularculaceae bacterium]
MPTFKLIDGALAPYTEEAPVEIALAEWRAGARPEAGRFALALPNDADVTEVVDSLYKFSAIVLDFPTFRDGRAYSQARLLRERCGYRGEIRARGEVLRDQAYFMARAGFDAFEIDAASAAAFSAALGEFSVVYQPAADSAEPAWRRRAARAIAA